MFQYVRSNLTDALDTEILLDGCLVAAKHGRPIKSAANDDAPETVSHRRAWIHFEKFHSPGIIVLEPNQRTTTGPTHPQTEDGEE